MAKRRKSKQVPETPTCNCLLLCEDVLESKAGRKHFLHGIVGEITVQRLPAVIGPFVAYVRVSNIYGTQDVRFELLTHEGDPVFALTIQSPPDSHPLGHHTLVMPLERFEVRSPGRYIFQASSKGEILAQSPIVVHTMESEDAP